MYVANPGTAGSLKQASGERAAREHRAAHRDHFIITQRGSFFDLSDLSPRNRLIAAAQSAEIVGLWRARQHHQLLRGEGG